MNTREQTRQSTKSARNQFHLSILTGVPRRLTFQCVDLQECKQRLHVHRAMNTSRDKVLLDPQRPLSKKPI